MSEMDVSKYELVDCWFYLDHTPPKGQGNWCGAIHKGACKLNSTDCKDTPTKRCLIKYLYKQLQQLKAENKELKEQYKLAEPLFQACKIKDLKIEKYKQCFDEIEEIVNYGSVSYNNHKELADFYEDKIEEIIKLIKQAKEGGNEI